MDSGNYSRHSPRYWLHALLLIITALTTTLVGARLALNFEHDLPAFEIERDLAFYTEVFSDPSLMLRGLPFSITLLAILLAHELGHYLTCVYYRIDASMPYFLPAPTLIGTFGAFIRIRAPIYSRRVLFDVGVAGPLAGFVFLVPALAIGLANSKVIPGIAERGDLIFGTAPMQRLLEMLIFPGVHPRDISLHPIARAAWAGVFATALNLLPIGQLDGGHILYSVVGERHRQLSRLFSAALIPLGIFYWYGWLLWVAFFFFTGMRRPSIYDDSYIGAERKQLALLALLIFLLCFTPAPISAGAGPP
jgi:membrane-associated protease RseP (regulator of RpoE activity)